MRFLDSQRAGMIAALCCAHGLSAQAVAAPADDGEEAELAAWNAEADRVQALPAFQWLNANRYSGTTTSLDNAIVEFVGYFVPDDLKPDLLEQLREGPLNPRLLVRGVPFEASRPIRVVRFPVPGHPGRECAALIQVRVRKDDQAALEEAERVVASYTHHLPQRPLTPACREGPPPPPPVEFSERIEIKSFGPLLIEPQRPCADFAPAKVGRFAITADTRIDNRRIVVGDGAWFRTGSSTIGGTATIHFDFFMRGFESYFYRSGLKEIMRYDYGNYAPRPQDITVALRVIEDPVTDAFCYVVDIAQGSATQRFVRTIPREGRTLPWNSSAVLEPIQVPDKSLFGREAPKSRPPQRIYNPGKSLIDWGTEIATDLLNESRT